MKRKLDTRFPAARIKKIMQADEDVGKIAMAVPLLVSKALELFLQDLCDRTFEVTLKKGGKTVNSLHLKQCVQSFNVFDFLRDTVKKVPDLGCGSEAAATDDRSATKRRKVSEDDECGNEDEPKRMCMNETGHITNSGRGRGRGRGRGSRTMEQERESMNDDKYEDDPDTPHQNGENQGEQLGGSNNMAAAADSRMTCKKDEDKPVIKFDLNIDLNENGDSKAPLAGPPPPPAPSDTSIKPAPEAKHEDVLGWSLGDVQRMAIDPVQFANLNSGIEDEEEDYDEEG